MTERLRILIQIHKSRESGKKNSPTRTALKNKKTINRHLSCETENFVEIHTDICESRADLRQLNLRAACDRFDRACYVRDVYYLMEDLGG